MTYPIPSAALDDRLAFVGTSGSGKTYNASSGVERVLARKARAVIVDPLGVWWGLRLAADGKTASPYDVVIFGGPRGDIAINEHSGALIGEAVATMAGSCVIDMSQIGTKAAERRFMLAFLTALYRHAAGEPLHLVVDEADMFAPQKLLDKEGEAAKLLGMMETVVRRGRIKGFIPWLITQRPAVLSKDVLSQADGLVAFKLTSSQDRDAIGAWIEGQADKKQGQEILASLPSMPLGQGVVWVPGRGILQRASFPQKATFDSSRTPKRGETVRTANLKPLDLGVLKDRLSAVEAEAKANDPKALKAEIAKLKSEKAALERAKPSAVPVDHDALADAERRGFERGVKETQAAAKQLVAAAVTEIVQDVSDAGAKVASEIGALRSATQERLKALKDDAKAVQPSYTPAPARPASVAPRPAPPVVAASGAFSAPQMKVLRALSMWRVLGHETPSREMVAAASGYSVSSGGFNNLLGGLATAGAIGKPMPGHLSLLTDVADMTPVEGRAMLLGYLSNPQRKLVDALNGAGDKTRGALGEATGYSASSGGFNNLIGSLSTLGIIVKPAAGLVALSEWAQELMTVEAP